MNPTKCCHKKQRGAVLLVALIMLGIMALIGTATINSSYVNKLLIGNQLSKLQTEQIGHNLIEIILSDIDYFTDPTSAPSLGTAIDGRTITASTPVCLDAREAGSYQMAEAGAASTIPEITYWTFDVTVSDPITGADTQMQYGTKFKLTAGNCP